MEDLLRALADLLAAPVAATINVALAIGLLVGIAGLRFNVGGWWRRRLILERAEALQRPERELVLARQRHEAELFAMCVQAAFVLIELVLATLPPTPTTTDADPGAPWQTLLIAPVWLGIQAALAIGSWRQHRYDRARVALPPVPADQQLSEGEIAIHEHH